MKIYHTFQALGLSLLICLSILLFCSAQAAPTAHLQLNQQPLRQLSSNGDELPDDIVQSIAISNDAPAPK